MNGVFPPRLFVPVFPWGRGMEREDILVMMSIEASNEEVESMYDLEEGS